MMLVRRIRFSLLIACLTSTAALMHWSTGFADDGAKENPKMSLQAFEDVKPQEFSWGWIRWLMNSETDPEAEMTLGMVYIKPNQSNPLHQHPNSAEYLHVLSGSCEHRLGDQWVTLRAGDTLRIPRGAIHSARTKDEPCRVMVVYDTGKRQMVTVDENTTGK